MTPERWAQIEALYHAVLEEPGKREALMAQADAEIRQEVESLLAQPSGGMLDSKKLDEPQRLEPGAALGPYRIESFVGAGGMGAVYKAADPRLRRMVAIKVLFRDRFTSPERRQRFLREARAASSLNHPGIVTVHDIGAADGADYIVQEFVSGTPLDRVLAQRRLSPDESMRLARQIVEALRAAHAAGIIHRDLKPANLMLTDDGQIKVLDFGLATYEHPDSVPRTRLTQTGAVLGTAAYMSPEQARGQPADRRADIWAFGAVLYEMLTGKRPFAGDSHAEVLSQVLNSTPEWSDLPSSTPPDVQRLLRFCLTVDRTMRLQAIGDARLFLDATPIDEARTAQAQPQRQPMLPWILAAFFAALALISAWGWWFAANRYQL